MVRITDYLYSYLRFLFDEHLKADFGVKYTESSYYDMTRKCYTNQYNKNCYTIYFTPDKEFERRLNYQGVKVQDLFLYSDNRNHHLELKALPYKFYSFSWEDFMIWLDENESRDVYDAMVIDSDPDFYKDKLKEWNDKFQARKEKAPTLELFNHKYDQCELAHFATLFEYSQDDIVKAVDYPTHEFKQAGYPISENRMWIPIDDKYYLVISKNPADVPWASQGNNFESCYSLRSNHGSIQSSMCTLTQIPWFCMTYITDGSLKEFTMFQRKFKLPQMKLRCWCYETTDGRYVLDRRFFNNKDKELEHYLRGVPLDWLVWNHSHDELQKFSVEGGTKEYYKIVHEKYRCYHDSIVPLSDLKQISHYDENGNTVVDYEQLYFKYDRRFCFSRTYQPRGSYESMANVPYNPELDYNEKCLLTTEKIVNVFISEKSHLLVDKGKPHWVDKYLERPVESCVIVTFAGNTFCPVVDMSHKIDTSCAHFYMGCSNNDYPCFENFSTVKEYKNYKLLVDNCRTWIKSENNTYWDCIVFRHIENDKVTITPCYSKQGQWRFKP